MYQTYLEKYAVARRQKRANAKLDALQALGGGVQDLAGAGGRASRKEVWDTTSPYALRELEREAENKALRAYRKTLPDDQFEAWRGVSYRSRQPQLTPEEIAEHERRNGA